MTNYTNNISELSYDYPDFEKKFKNCNMTPEETCKFIYENSTKPIEWFMNKFNVSFYDFVDFYSQICIPYERCGNKKGVSKRMYTPIEKRGTDN